VLKCTPVWNLKIKLRIIVETQKSHTHWCSWYSGKLSS
jgi:hypothetical protein